MRRTVGGSRPENGSSQSSRSGFSISARARPARFTMPPESWPGNSVVDGLEADGFEDAVHLVADLRFAEFAVLAQRQRDVVEDAHRVEQRAALEEHPDAAPERAHARRRPSARRSASPSMRIAPRSGWIRHAIMRSSVVLPEPDGPASTLIRPRGKTHESPSMITRAPRA